MVSKKKQSPGKPGKIKLYADENIRYDVVLALRLQGINIKHANEVSLTNKDDQTHFQYAKKTNRWLLTSDRHFLDDNCFPFEQTRGIVVVPQTGDDLMAGRIMAWLKYELIPSGKDIDSCKVELREKDIIFHFRREGKIYVQRLKL